MKPAFQPLFLLAALSLAFSGVGLRAAEAPPAPAPTGDALPAGSFFEPEPFRLPALSPDGNRLAYVGLHEGRYLITHLDLLTGKSEGLLLTANIVLQLFWKGNDTLVYRSGGSLGSSSVSALGLDKSTRNLSDPSPNATFVGTILSDCPALPDEIVLAARSAGATLLRRVNVRTAASVDLYSPTEGDRYRIYLVTASGVPCASMRLDSAGLEAAAWDPARSTFVPRKLRHPLEPGWCPLGCTNDGTVYLVTFDDVDTGALHTFDPATGVLGPATFSDPRRQTDDVVLSRDGARLLGVRVLDEEGARTEWFDPARRKLQAQLDRSFPGQRVSLVSSSLDDRVQVLRVGSARKPCAWYVLDLRHGGLRLICQQLPRVAAVPPFAQCESVEFPAGDGLTLHGYLVSPSTPPAADLPLVIFPDEAPFRWRIVAEYSPLPQFLASRGYRVLMLNYRGASGYGLKYLVAGNGQIGGRILSDLADATQWAVARGLARPGRVALVGYGLAGGLALAVAEQHPAMFCGIVNHEGIVDWRGLHARGVWTDSVAMGGLDYGAQAAVENGTAPLSAIARLTVPVLHFYDLPFGDCQTAETAFKTAHRPFDRAQKESNLAPTDREAWTAGQILTFLQKIAVKG